MKAIRVKCVNEWSGDERQEADYQMLFNVADFLKAVELGPKVVKITLSNGEQHTAVGMGIEFLQELMHWRSFQQPTRSQKPQYQHIEYK